MHKRSRASCQSIISNNAPAIIYPQSINQEFSIRIRRYYTAIFVLLERDEK